MNFDDAMRAHAAWKLKLSSYLRKPDGTLLPTRVGADNQCDLGRWLHANRAAWAHDPTYQELVTEHARFHHAAADVVLRADKGQSVAEDTAIGAASAFGRSSSRVNVLLVDIKRKAQTGALPAPP